MYNIDSTVSGVPCLIKINYAHPADCENFAEICFDVLTTRGKPTPWLERKLTVKDVVRIEAEILTYLYNKHHD